MKKVFVTLTSLVLCTTVAFAEDIAVQEPVITSEYVEYTKENNSSFFIGVESVFASYNTVKMTDDTDLSSKTHTFNLNTGIFDSMSLMFGFGVGNSGRAVFKVSQTNVETETTDSGVGVYALQLDMPIIKHDVIAPFLRLGMGYVSAEESNEDFSAVTFTLGFGVNYNITKNVFAYGLLNYDFMPEAELGDTGMDYKESMFSMVAGVGYKF